MSISLYSEAGWVTDLCSAGALSLLANAISSKSGISELGKFIDQGTTDKIPETIDDLNVVIPYITDKNVKGVATTLKNGLTKIKDKEVAIIST